MAAVIGLKNPVKVRKTGFQAFDDTGTEVLMRQHTSSGDYTKEKYERPELPFEALSAEIRNVSNEMKAGTFDIHKHRENIMRQGANSNHIT